MVRTDLTVRFLKNILNTSKYVINTLRIFVHTSC